MYESPINIIQKEIDRRIRESVDGTIYEAVLKTDVHVDRDELLRALRYDRDQYVKGYVDGKRDAERHGQWIEDLYFDNPFVCSYCGHEGCYVNEGGNKQYYPTYYCPNCGAKMEDEDG